MRAIVSLTLALAVAHAAWWQEADAETLPALAVDGEPQYRIELGRDMTPSELLAVSELSTYLARVTGTGDKYDGGRPHPEGWDGRTEGVIYVGQTEFARANGLDGALMEAEEWAVRTVGSNLILTGGRPRGTLYAVYEFLEEVCGVRWLDRDTEVVPSRPDLVLPPVDRRGRPAMWFRWLGQDRLLDGDEEGPAAMAAELRFLARNRCPASTWGTQRRHASSLIYGEQLSPHRVTDVQHPVAWSLHFLRDAQQAHRFHCHGFYAYVPPSDFYAEHPEYYGFTREDAPATPPGLDGSLCLTHPEVRQIVIERLKRLIAEDRGLERSFGIPAPRFYDVSQMDNSRPCQCAACRDFVAEHGRESDLVIDFVNAVADGIRDEYPDVLVETLAYVWSMAPPRTIRPRDNVLVNWCNWWGGDGAPALDQALTHPHNSWRLNTLRGWNAAGARLGVWEYMAYATGDRTIAPVAIAPYSMQNLRIYGEMGAEWFYDCSPHGPGNESFPSLRRWTSARLLNDPTADVEALLDTFFEGYFGPAAGRMREFYDLLVECQDRPRSRRQLADASATLDYLTPEFYQTASRLFDEAEALCTEPDADGHLLRVRQERLRVDLSLLELWGDLERQLPDAESLPFDRTTVINRYEANAEAVMDGRLRKDTISYRREVERDVAYYRDPRLPDPIGALQAREVCDITARHFSPWHLSWPRRNETPDDPAAAYGRTMAFRPETGWRDHAVEFTVDEIGATIPAADLPRDGTYRVFELGRTHLAGEDTNFKVLAHDGADMRVLGGLDLGQRLNRRDRAAEWDIFVAARADNHRIYVERILLTRAVTGNARPADEQLRQATLGEAPNPWSQWHFRMDPDDRGMEENWQAVEFDEDEWRQIRVPAFWAETWAGAYLGYGWYRTTFAVPQEWAGQQVNLNFGGVDEQAWVFVNGELVGEHTVESEGMTVGQLWNRPFTIEVPAERLLPGEENTLVVRVHASRGNAGIHQPVVGHAPHPEQWRPLPER